VLRFAVTAREVLRRAFPHGPPNAPSDLTPLMDRVGRYLVEHVRRNLSRGESPEGRPWFAGKRGPGHGWPPINEPDLARSVRYRAEPGRVEVYTTHTAAELIQRGGRTRAHRIAARPGKLLVWPGATHPVAAVWHPGSRIPERPFMGVAERDWPGIAAIARKFFRDIQDVQRAENTRGTSPARAPGLQPEDYTPSAGTTKKFRRID